MTVLGRSVLVGVVQIPGVSVFPGFKIKVFSEETHEHAIERTGFLESDVPQSYAPLRCFRLLDYRREDK
ncbi:hypothetical protein BDM02DRAFT_3122139 [Thelephora ganbajun]|uniref:Uncharacterized protein n=1 Tax=Thelephora ganbajun TaxID=370292 RepID=A0ACB6Z422_THEGA|nr:hypothetical protein BDM02DRAFT_3122139 [Thelephora ganbajun]